MIVTTGTFPDDEDEGEGHAKPERLFCTVTVDVGVGVDEVLSVAVVGSGGCAAAVAEGEERGVGVGVGKEEGYSVEISVKEVWVQVCGGGVEEEEEEGEEGVGLTSQDDVRVYVMSCSEALYEGVGDDDTGVVGLADSVAEVVLLCDFEIVILWTCVVVVVLTPTPAGAASGLVVGVAGADGGVMGGGWFWAIWICGRSVAAGLLNVVLPSAMMVSVRVVVTRTVMSVLEVLSADVGPWGGVGAGVDGVVAAGVEGAWV